MGKFIENMLRDEEKLAGFNPGEPDEDTFTVPESGYPADLPYLSDIEADVANISDDIINDALNIAPKAVADASPNINEVTSAEQIEIPAEGNVWDAFGLDDEEDSQEAGDNPLEEPAFFEETAPEPDNKQINQDAFNDEPSFDDFNDAFDEAPVEKPVAAAAQETISLEPDNELQSIIMADKKRSDKRKKTQKAKVEEKPRDFKPVDNDAEAHIIDITKMNIDDNSKTTVAKSPKPQPDKAKTQVQEKNKKKRAFPWILAAISAAALFLMTIGILIYYIYNYQPEFANKLGIMTDDTYAEKYGKESYQTKKDIVNKPENEKVAEKNTDKTAKKESEKESEKKVDDLAINDKAKQDSINAVIEAYKKEMQANQNDDKLKIAKTDYNVNKPKSKIAENSKIKPKKHAIPEKKKTEKSNAKPVKKDIATIIINKPAKEKPANVTNTTPATSLEDKSIKTLNQLEAEGTFVVQIYSSPSKDDAEDWLNRLINKNLRGYISEHKVRDVIWYRVRFGEFSSKDEARAAAMKYGFAQSWIDRIR